MRGMIFHGEGSADEAKGLARLRGATLRDAAWFDGQYEPCDFVTIMPDVPGFQRRKIVAAFGDKVERPAPVEERKIVSIDPTRDWPELPVQLKRKRGRPRKVVI